MQLAITYKGFAMFLDLCPSLNMTVVFFTKHKKLSPNGQNNQLSEWKHSDNIREER